MNMRWFMNRCKRNQEAMALMVAGACPEREQRRAENHLQTCAACREYFRDIKAITGDLARLKKAGGQAAPSTSLRTRWTEQILNESAGPKTKAPLPDRRVRPVAGWWPAYRPWLSWGLATTTCVLVAFVIGYRHGRTAAADPLENAKLIRETLAMFPHRVRAIVQDEHGLNLVLSDNEDVPVSAPLYIHVCDGKQCSSYLTFSGQEITVAGQKVTVLADTQGGVILEGRHFLWSAADHVSVAGNLKIETRNLGSTVM